MVKLKLYKRFTTRTKKSLTFFCIILVFLLVLVSLVLQQSRKPVDENHDQTYTYDYNQIDKFVYDINKNGPQIVYQQVKDRTQNLPYTTKHKIAHLFGKALYKAKKDSGISVCDTNLSYGCYHGLLIEAINTEGESAVSRLDHYCQTAGNEVYTACQHGIGHGLVEYLGRNRISEALKNCEKIQKTLLTGCSSGVFMEYFQPSAMNKDTSSLVAINPTDPFKICNSVQSIFVNSCIYELPRLWRRTEPNLLLLANRCITLQDPTQQKSCFRGIGYITGDTANPNPEHSIYVCNKTPNDQTKLYCLSGAAWFYKFLDQIEVATRALNTLCKSSVDESLCQQQSDLNLDHI